MLNDTENPPSLDAFFNGSIDGLQDDHYVIHGNECDICDCDEKADPSEIVYQASSVSSTAITQAKTCPSPHLFHKLCLYTWLHTKLHKDEDATCPVCRTRLIMSARSERMQVCLEQLKSLVGQYNAVIENSLLRMNRIADGYQQAKQDQDDDSTDDAEKLELLNQQRALTTALRTALATNELAEQDLAECLDAIRRVEAYIAISDQVAHTSLSYLMAGQGVVEQEMPPTTAIRAHH
ncbi:hypothetical protein G6011_05123 [Alternaria panax]|uniref:RING-type domain-containing protein n=1 Tax=Alternaria panax TaxID=48097 RepID=A0AAD4FC20_9PLEO|nr:hypothetical protein G6011_05123 [Alternaria panax]